MVIREVHEDLVLAAKEFLAQRQEFGYCRDWEGLFRYRWKRKEFPYGYAAMDGDKMVGFIGTIFSERVIQGRKVPYCNMSTWVVDSNHRSMLLGLLMLERIFRTKDVFVTSLTPSDSSRDISERMGFKFLDTDQITVPILPQFSLPWNGARKPTISFDPREICKLLREADRFIFEDHRDLPCTHFLIRERDTGLYCYGIGTTSVLRRLRLFGVKWLNVCYLSNADVFVRNFPKVRNAFWSREKFLLLRYDSRLIPDRISSIEFKSKRARQFKAKEYSSVFVDNLYSELVTFNKY